MKPKGCYSLEDLEEIMLMYDNGEDTADEDFGEILATAILYEKHINAEVTDLKEIIKQTQNLEIALQARYRALTGITHRW